MTRLVAGFQQLSRHALTFLASDRTIASRSLNGVKGGGSVSEASPLTNTSPLSLLRVSQ
jgi:hypothetical protein